ncbi:unnamed protein product [Prorocentrum cordatum]|uniref:Uncharacterized protein n=1 Tax=Prorocentrum cordatum TaxID=2364126 RepID=A0ABN9SA65_9DINO|nr:unnamed protein product [Polarella glacialis]
MVAPAVADDVTEEREARRRELKACMAVEATEDVEALRTALEAAKEVRLEKEDVLPAETLLRRLDGKFQPLTFSDVSHADVLRLNAARSRESVVAILLQCFRVQLESSFLSEIIAEFHYHNYLFCQRSRWCAEKTSTLLSLMGTVFSRAMDGECPVKQARALLNGLVARHSRQLPPFSLGVFSAQEATAVREHAERTLFRHYDMYVFCVRGVRARETDLCVRTVRQRVANEMVEPVELLTSHEVNPREVPELGLLPRSRRGGGRPRRGRAGAAPAGGGGGRRGRPGPRGGRPRGGSRRRDRRCHGGPRRGPRGPLRRRARGGSVTAEGVRSKKETCCSSDERRAARIAFHLQRLARALPRVQHAGSAWREVARGGLASPCQGAVICHLEFQEASERF